MTVEQFEQLSFEAEAEWIKENIGMLFSAEDVNEMIVKAADRNYFEVNFLYKTLLYGVVDGKTAPYFWWGDCYESDDFPDAVWNKDDLKHIFLREAVLE